MNIKTLPLIGGKSSSDLKLLCDLYEESESVLFFDPFAGSLRMSIAILDNSPRSIVCSAESDYGLRCIHKLMLTSNRDRLEDLYNELKQDLLNDSDYWSEIQKIASGWHEDEKLIGIARYIYQQNSIISTSRYGSNGHLDGKLDVSKYSRLKNRPFNLPDYNQYCGRIYIAGDYTDYTDSNWKLQIRNSFVNLDPPYYAPGKTKCYQDHDPNNCYVSVDATRSYLHNQPKRLLMWNYYSDQLHIHLHNLAHSYGFKVTLKELADLDTAKKTKSSDLPNDRHTLWIFDRLKD